MLVERGLELPNNKYQFLATVVMGPRQETISVGAEESKPQEGLSFSSSAVRKYPTDRDIPVKTGRRWLEGKRKDDDIGDLWRVHDKLYDLTTFIDKHPGGRMWLKETRGTDITEAFESAHLWEAAEKILPKYFVKDAQGPRNSVYTFHEDGFYKTLKRRVRPILKKTGRGPSWATYVIQDGLAFTFVIFTLLAANHGSYTYAALAGFFLANTASAAHNFFHQRDNWHMYLFDLTLSSSHDWRITHGLSHHLFPNTIYDIEITALEPFYQFLPRTNKSWVVQYGSLAYSLLLDPILFLVEGLKKISLIIKGCEKLRPENFLPLGQLLVMWILRASLLEALRLWIVIHVCCSFWFATVGLTAAHHHPDIYHEGDKFRKDNPDWGLCTLDATRDRVEVSGRLPLVLTTFGDHTLHHLFPTVDHSRLPLLYPELIRTSKEFGFNFAHVRQLEMFLGRYKQLMNVTPNPNAPGVRTLKNE